MDGWGWLIVASSVCQALFWDWGAAGTNGPQSRSWWLHSRDEAALGGRETADLGMEVGELETVLSGAAVLRGLCLLLGRCLRWPSR